MDGFPCDVIPIGSGFVINQKYQAVIEPSCTEVMKSAVDDRCQTDTAVADDSEGDDIRFACQFTLRDMVIDHLLCQHRSVFCVAFKNDEALCVVET